MGKYKAKLTKKRNIFFSKFDLNFLWYNNEYVVIDDNIYNSDSFQKLIDNFEIITIEDEDSGSDDSVGEGTNNDVSFEIINENMSNVSVNPSDSINLEIPFTNKGELKTIYLKAQQNSLPFTVEIYDQPNGIVEYSSSSNIGICYDIVNIIYIDQLSMNTLYMKIINESNSQIDFDLVRVRGIKL